MTDTNAQATALSPAGRLLPAIAISGVSYNAACDPRISNVPGEENWPTPRARRVGKGQQYIYPGNIAELVATHLEEVGSDFIIGEEPTTRAEGRAMLRDARRWRTRVANSMPSPQGAAS